MEVESINLIPLPILYGNNTHTNLTLTDNSDGWPLLLMLPLNTVISMFILPMTLGTHPKKLLGTLLKKPLFAINISMTNAHLCNLMMLDAPMIEKKNYLTVKSLNKVKVSYSLFGKDLTVRNLSTLVLMSVLGTAVKVETLLEEETQTMDHQDQILGNKP